MSTHNVFEEMEKRSAVLPADTAYDFGNVNPTFGDITADSIDANGEAAVFVFDEDGDTVIESTSDDTLQFKTGGSVGLQVTNSLIQSGSDRAWQLNNVATLAAAGSTIGDAAAVAAQITYVTGADEAKGVVLPAATPGQMFVIHNAGTDGLKVYPASGDDIADFTASAPGYLPGYKSALFVCLDLSTWAVAGEVEFHQAVTATTGGGTTGLIHAKATLVTVTSDDANKQISLPVGSLNREIIIHVGGTGCELISAVAADKVNNVTVGATNELALAANTIFKARYYAADNWLVTGTSSAGAEVADAALIPDAL